VPTVWMRLHIIMSLFREGLGRAVISIFDILAIMVLINRVSRELSIGCQFVFWSKFGPASGCESEIESGPVYHFLALFLTDSIEQKSSNQAHYTSNRYSSTRAFQNDTYRPQRTARTEDMVGLQRHC